MIFVVSGPAGSGKGTVVGKLREMMPNIGFSVSATTRPPRPGEIDGVNYHFITREKFTELLEAGEVLEHTEYCGNMYGTLKSEAVRTLNEGRDIILEIEVEGALQIKSMMPDEAVAVMLIAPDPEELERRLRGRGTESDAVIKRRLKRSVEEIGLAENYDYVVINETGKTDECAAKIQGIINAEHLRYQRMKDTVNGYAAGQKI